VAAVSAVGSSVGVDVSGAGGATATMAAKQQTYSSANGFVRWVVMTKPDQLIVRVNARGTDDVTHVNTSVRWRPEVRVQPLVGNAHYL